MLVQPNGAPATVQQSYLSTEAVKTMIDFENLCTALGLQFWMRCKKCMELDLPDGVQGEADSRGLSFHVRCACTHRVGHKV